MPNLRTSAEAWILQEGPSYCNELRPDGRSHEDFAEMAGLSFSISIRIPI